jgi:hypothetical protein
MSCHLLNLRAPVDVPDFGLSLALGFFAPLRLRLEGSV